MMPSQPISFDLNRRKLVLSTITAWVLFRLVVITVRGINIGIEAISPVTAIELSMIGGLLIWLLKGGRPETVATLLLLVLTMPLLLFTYISGGLHGPVVTIGLCFPLMAFLMIGKLGGWVASGFILIFYTCVALLNIQTDFFPENRLSPQGLFIAKALSLSMVSLLLSWIGWYYAKLYDRQVSKLHRKNIELERIAQYRQDFLSNMSHEFRTPLNSIIGFTKRVLKTQNDTLDSRSIDALNTVMRTGTSLNDLVNQILDISKLESGQVTLNNQSIEVYPWVEECCATHKVEAQEKDLDFTLLADESINNLTVLIDTSKLKSLLTNLISNAIKYTHSGGITIECSKLDDIYFKIAIKDTGEGIPEDKLVSLFDKFSRLETHEKSTIVGTGLGLAIVEEISKLLGGKITVSSVLDKGSCFSVTLPIRPANID